MLGLESDASVGGVGLAGLVSAFAVCVTGVTTFALSLTGAGLAATEVGAEGGLFPVDEVTVGEVCGTLAVTVGATGHRCP